MLSVHTTLWGYYSKKARCKNVEGVYIAFSQIQVKLCKFRALVSTGLYRAIALLFVHALPYLSVYCRVLTELDPCIPVALFALSDY